MLTNSPGGDRESESRPAGRRLRWLLPAALILVWLAVGGVGGPVFGLISEVQENDNSAFLPASAEATRVSELQAEFADADVIPALVVYERAGGITRADIAAAGEDAESFQDVPGVLGEVSPPVPSGDGDAVQVIVPLDADLGDAIIDSVEEIRSAAGPAPEGLSVWVTGPGGFLADFSAAFGSIDTLLLGVALAVVFVILLVVYRSPLLPVVVLATSVFALSAAIGVVYLLAKADLITLNGQSQGILFILVIGAATDYSLLLVARVREELREHESRFRAVGVALRQSVEPIVASGGTVILGVLCLLFSDLNSNRSLGPVAATGIVFSILSALTFLPAVLALLGRSAFWPAMPRHGSEHRESSGVWGRVARLVSQHPRRTWVMTGLALLAAVAFAPGLKASGVSQSELLLGASEAVDGQDALVRHFDAGTGSPAVIIGPAGRVDDLVSAVESEPGVSTVTVRSDAPASGRPTVPAPGTGRSGGSPPAPKVVDGKVEINATLVDPADSDAALDTVGRLRDTVGDVAPSALVGGQTAIQLDTNVTSKSDRNRIIPLVLVVILVVLMLLLRSILAPVLLIATVVLSFGATLGVSALVFNELLGLPGADPAVPLFGFVFLVALGIDYNIFLMTRVREESIKHGTRPGILRGLTLTGGVITSAGIVLAATFSALAVIPILFLLQIAFIVAFGVLLDTLLVRSLLVPALAYDIGSRIWWPSRLGRESPDEPPRADERPVAVVSGS